MEATSTEDYAAGRTLIEEYAAALGVDLCFQNFSEEIANLPKVYGPPGGRLLLARIDGETVGCVAVRNQGAAACEMKRLYVRPQYRGAGLGRRLVELAIKHAQQLGYSRMVLDTLPSMTEAQSLYESLGFREVEGYYPNPLDGVRFLTRELSRPILVKRRIRALTMTEVQLPRLVLNGNCAVCGHNVARLVEGFRP